jgi:hypothetical protein
MAEEVATGVRGSIVEVEGRAGTGRLAGGRDMLGGGTLGE